MRTTREQELELAALAGAAERRNRPRLGLAVAFLLLTGAAGYALLGSGSVASARTQAERAARDAAGVERLATEIDAILARRQENDAEARFPIDAALRSKLVEIARASGITEEVAPEARPEQRGLDYPLVKQVVTITLSDAGLEAALDFISRATREIPGLFVEGVQLQPRPQGWYAVLRFARWEVRR